jgi:transcriptional antiterminator NusG
MSSQAALEARLMEVGDPLLRCVPEQAWIVAHVKPRQEKALSRELDKTGIVHYLPLIRELRTHGGRKRWVDSPLFSGYIFARGGPGLKGDLRRTDRVVSCIDVSDQERLCTELNQIKAAIAAGAEFNPYPSLREGEPARIARGPLRGVEGVIDRTDGVTKLVLIVHTLGRATAIEVNPADVESAE